MLQAGLADHVDADGFPVIPLSEDVDVLLAILALCQEKAAKTNDAQATKQATATTVQSYVSAFKFACRRARISMPP